MPTPKQVYQLKVTLDDVSPPIWRRLLVSEDTNLLTLHEIIQKAMDWGNYHLHMFTIARQIYGDPEDDEYGELGSKDETRYRLNQLGLGEKARFQYEYDFGDGWQHTVLVEKILPAEKGMHYPVCLKGKRACPPEDVGGVWGYENFLEAIANPKHKEHHQYIEWIGGDFDPEAFDLDEVNKRLRHIKPARDGRTFSGTGEDDESDAAQVPTEQEQLAMAESMQNWLSGLDAKSIALFESLPLRRDMLTFLDYLSENKAVGTQATGNLPLKAVHAICARFVDPPKLEETIGSRTFKARNEDDVWPLFFVHTLAFQSRMVDGGPSRRWKVTPEVEMFQQFSPPMQIVFLLSNWVFVCDWGLAYPDLGLQGDMLTRFKAAAMNTLLSLPEDETVPFESFANQVIEESDLIWTSQNEDFVQMMKRSVVERLLIDPMTRFGILECSYRPSKILGDKYKDLDTLRLTTLGKLLWPLLKQAG